MIWQCRDKAIEYGTRVLVMGIVNVTPDSFSDGGCYVTAEAAVAHALTLLQDGADIIDLGAQSTRPGYQEITPEEEWQRLQPVITALRQQTAAPLSVDTYFPSVAANALAAGADIINDVSGTVSLEMAQVVQQYGAGWVIMHSGAGGIETVKAFFPQAAAAATAFGVRKEQLCFDMGIGFGKSVEENLALLANVEKYKYSGYPLLLGVSRKRVIGAAGGEQTPFKRLPGNVAADSAAICGGVDMIRIHDVKNEIQGIRTAEALKAARC
ncbi:MAG: dihydropteroate synthase [Eubacterium sp.]|nr:dihydropteroate synthase [Eubacterium sp.]